MLGAIFGSFIAALVIRWPRGESILKGRSHCDHCGVQLSAIDLIPLVSAIRARGRCRACGGVIDPLHWRIEGAAIVVGIASGFAAPGTTAVAAAVFGWLLIALAALDITEFWLPDALTGTLALAGLGAGALGIFPPLDERLIGGSAGFGSLWIIATGYRLLRGREGLGGGDPKLFGAIGLWIGWWPLPMTLVLASMVGLGVVLVRMVGARAVRADDRLPFGALLAVAAYPSLLAMLIVGR